MCDWTDCPGARGNSALEGSSSSYSNSGSRSSDSTASVRAPPRFSEFVSDDELSTLSKGLVPANTSRNTKWALKTFEEWRNARNLNFPQDPVPDNLFMCTDPAVLSVNLSRFSVEARKSSGEHYPPSSIHQLLCGLLRHMREVNPHCPNFLDKKDASFRQLHHTLDVHFHKLHSDGIGRKVKQTDTISKDEEKRLWKSGVLGDGDPKSLQNAVFYALGKTLCLRGGIEHRALKLSQLERRRQPDHYVYIENVSKNRNGSFKQLHVKGKTVPVYKCPELGSKCPVYLLDKYISKLPPKAIENDVFYVRALDKVPSDPAAPWYSVAPIGKHTLSDKVKKMCNTAGIVGHKTNHSLRATGATQMYESGVPEKLIQERTGHRSIEALRMYERSNSGQHQAVSRILSDSQRRTYQHTERHSMLHMQSAMQQMQSTPFIAPGLSFQNLHGCTINITQTPPPQPMQSIDVSESELEQIIAEITDF